MSEVKHTPLPWRSEKALTSDGGDFWGLYGANQEAIAYLTLRGPNELGANVALIVQAVNNHYALIEVLKELIDHCWETEKALTEKGYRMDYCGESIVLCNARRTLSLAKGEQA